MKKQITIIMILIIMIIISPNNVYADACGFKYEYPKITKVGDELSFTISTCRQQYEYYVEYDKSILEFKESNSYSDSTCAGTNYKDVVNVEDKDGKLTIKRQIQGNCQAYDGIDSYVTLTFKTSKEGKTPLKIYPTVFYMQQVNGDNEKVEYDSESDQDILSITVDIIQEESKTTDTECTACQECQKQPECEICQECKKCTDIESKDNKVLYVALTISIIGNIGILTALIITLIKNKKVD